MLNVDGLRLDLDVDALKAVRDYIGNVSAVLGRLLDQCPKATLAISFDEEV